MVDQPLTSVQEKMLQGAFYIDSRHNRDYLDDAEALVRRGLLKRTEGGDSQHTSYHYTPTQGD